ncbi:MAG: WD40 repeat domain-containing protein [Rubripirellula sp.]
MNRTSIAFCLMCSFATLLSVPLAADDSKSPATGAVTTWVTSIAPLGSSSQFVAATADGLLLREATVYSFDAADPSKMTALYSHPAAVWCVDTTDDGSKVASVDYRGNLVVFDTKANKAKTHEKAFERWCQAMTISPDGKSVVAGNEAGKVMIWDFETGKVSKSVELDGHAVTGLDISPDGSRVAASDGGGHVHLLKWPSLESEASIEVSKETAWCVAFVEDGKQLLVGSSDRNVYQCAAKADAKVKSVAKGSDWITQLAVSPSGQVAAGEVGGRLHFPSTGGTDSMDATSGVWALCWNGDGQLFAGTRKNGIVMAGRSWKWTQPKPPEPKKEPKQEPKADAEKPAEEKEMKTPPADEKAKAEKPAKKAKPKVEPKQEKAKPAEKKEAKPAKKSEAKSADKQPVKDGEKKE